MALSAGDHLGPYEIVEPLGDLKQALERGPIPVDEALAMAEQVAEALEEVHELSVCVVNRCPTPALGPGSRNDTSRSSRPVV